MKQLFAIKRGNKLYIVMYGTEYELILPVEDTVKPLSENLKKKIAGKVGKSKK